MKKYIAPEVGITYFESESIMSGENLMKLSLLDSTNLFDGDTTTKKTDSISFDSLIEK